MIEWCKDECIRQGYLCQPPMLYRRSRFERLKIEGGILEQEFGKLQATVASLEIEIEAMRSAGNSYKMHYENLARDIFEEIERTCVDSFGCFYMGATHGAFAELKKKYTEEKE